MKLLAVDLSHQLLPGTFEHALAHLIDQELDLSHFDAHSRNDERGSAAYPPAVLLKVVLFAYSQGLVSSRAIERACRDHVTFMALSGDSAPHFATIAAFVSGREQDIAQVFAAVLSICLNQGLIGQEMFAIDGVKLPSNASKARRDLLGLRIRSRKIWRSLLIEEYLPPGHTASWDCLTEVLKHTAGFDGLRCHAKFRHLTEDGKQKSLLVAFDFDCRLAPL